MAGWASPVRRAEATRVAGRTIRKPSSAVRHVADRACNGGGSVGVVTPFTAQARLIDGLLRRDRRVGSEHLAEADFALLASGLRLNVEVDGDHHVNTRAKLRGQDGARDRILAGIGWDVIRIPAWRCTWEVDAAILDIPARIAESRALTEPR